MAEAIIYTILAIFAVYGMYTAAREAVLFLGRLRGKKESSDELCHGCRGCSRCEDAKDEPQDDDDDDRDFFCT